MIVTWSLHVVTCSLHPWQLDILGIAPNSGALRLSAAFSNLGVTVRHFAVALALVQLIGVSIFCVWFVQREYRMRRARKVQFVSQSVLHNP